MLEKNHEMSFKCGLYVGKTNADCMPETNIRPVVFGNWEDAIQNCNDSPHTKCSVCGEYYWEYFKDFNFCPNCGAYMKGNRVMEEQVKIILIDGRLFVEYEDGSRLPIMADKNGNVYVEDD